MQRGTVSTGCLAFLCLTACGGPKIDGTGSGDANRDASSPDPSLDSNVVVSRSDHASFEATIAADGLGRVVAAWITVTPEQRLTIGYSISNDRGLTWSPAGLIRTTDDAAIAADPTLDVDTQGTFYLAFIGLKAPDMPRMLYLTMLPRQAYAFEAAARIDEIVGNPDGPLMRIDNSGRILLSYTTYPAVELWIATSSDSGHTFSTSRVASDGRFGSICVDRTLGVGVPLYIAHWGLQPPTADPEIQLLKSLDDGRSWVRTSTAPVARHAAFTAPTCVTLGNEVWILHGFTTRVNAARGAQSSESVRLVHSANQGETYDWHITLSRGVPGMEYLFPRMTSTRDELSAIYLEGRPGESAELALISFGGAKDMTWLRSSLIETGTFTADNHAPDWLGDYAGLVAADDRIYIAYVDNSVRPSVVRVISRRAL